MRSKKFLALTLAFCMACSGTVSVGASVSDNQKEEQQGDVLEETDESGQVQKDESSAPEALENEGIENDGNLISGPEEPQGQQEEPAGSEELAGLENLADAEDSGNAKLEESGVVDEKCWDLKNTPQYKLRKSENSEEYFTAADGIAAVRKNGADAYYVFDQNGVMQTGLYTISRNGTETYYFLTAEDTKKDCNESEDGIIIPNPLNSRIGQMVTEEGWIQVGDRWLYMKEGGIELFKEERAPEGSTPYCLGGCKAKENCIFDAEKIYITSKKTGVRSGSGWLSSILCVDGTEEAVRAALEQGQYGRCVYHCDNNVVDHQQTNLLMEDGSTISFTMCAFTEDCYRTFKAMGTLGEIEADMKSNTIRVRVFGQEEELIDLKKLAQDLKGHGGGDSGIIADFLDMLLDNAPPTERTTTLVNSMESHYIALAAEESRKAGGKLMDMAEFKNQ